MLNAGVLTFKEFAMREPLPLATIHEAMLEFLRGRTDVAVFGATAANAYVDEPICVLNPPELIAHKVISYHSRRGQPKGFSDMRDLAILFLTFPELKTEAGEVSEALKRLGASPEEMNTWDELVAQEINSASDDDEFN